MISSTIELQVCKGILGYTHRTRSITKACGRDKKHRIGLRKFDNPQVQVFGPDVPGAVDF